MSVTTPVGFVAAGVHCGVKADPDALDLALVATDDGVAVPCAAVFTTNRAPAAPVEVSRAHLSATGGRAAAVVLNSGNANAATGSVGREHAERTCTLVAEAVGCAPEEVVVCSTGLIGIPLDIDAVVSGVGPLVAARAADPASGAAAAEAILTTDTVAKQIVVTRRGFTIGAMAKGAAMLAPNMATMLAVITTDAVVGPTDLNAALGIAVAHSFNDLTVDGSTSTNDTVMVLSSARGSTPSGTVFSDALAEACASLAAQMADDAEGATKVVTLRVVGAASPEEATRAARAVAESQLVKCSLYGADPYWGRIVSQLGSAGVTFDPDLVSVAYGGTTVCAGGVAAAHDAVAVAAHLRGRRVDIVADLGLGAGEARVLTNDLTPGYIDENMRTS